MRINTNLSSHKHLRGWICTCGTSLMWSLILLLGSPVTTFLHFLLALRKERLFVFHSTQWGFADLPLALSPASFPACDNNVAALIRQQRMLNINESIKIDLGGFIKELSKHSGNLKKPFWDCSQASQVKVWQPPAKLVSKNIFLTIMTRVR